MEVLPDAIASWNRTRVPFWSARIVSGWVEAALVPFVAAGVPIAAPVPGYIVDTTKLSLSATRFVTTFDALTWANMTAKATPWRLEDTPLKNWMPTSLGASVDSSAAPTGCAAPSSGAPMQVTLSVPAPEYSKPHGSRNPSGVTLS